MPEMTDAQLASFRRVTAAEHQRLRQGTLRPVGRPPKAADERGKATTMRFSPQMLRALKQRASQSGFKGWQTYAKKILEDALGLK